MSEIAEKVKSIIVDKLGVGVDEVTPEATFQQDLGADSLDIVELMMQLENEFPRTMPTKSRPWARPSSSSRTPRLEQTTINGSPFASLTTLGEHALCATWV